MRAGVESYRTKTFAEVTSSRPIEHAVGGDRQIFSATSSAGHSLGPQITVVLVGVMGATDVLNLLDHLYKLDSHFRNRMVGLVPTYK